MAPTPASIQDADPDDLGRREFTKQRKGWDPVEVRAHLLALAAEIKRLRTLAEEQRRTVERLESELANQRELDESRLTQMLGEETARVLEAARTAAAEIREKAEDKAARMVREAQERSEELLAEATTTRDTARQEAEELRSTVEAEVAEAREAARADGERIREEAQREAEELRQAASTVLEERTAEAEEAAEAIRAQASELLRTTEEAAAEQRAQAEADAEEIRANAAAEAERVIEEATERGRSIVAEARDARERMLADLAERRTASRRQLEALRAGRERLLEAFATARQSFDTLTDELTDSLPAAREAAERAAAEVEPGDEDPDALADELGLEDLSELDDVPAAAPAAAAEEATEAETTAGDEPEADAPEVASTAEAHAEGDAAVDEAAEETEAEQPISLEAVEPSQPESADAPEAAAESSAASHLRLVQGGGSDDDDHHDEDDDLHDDEVATADVDPASGAAEAIFARLRADADEHDEPAERSDEPGASDDLAARGVEPVPFPEQGPSEGGVVVALNGGDVAVLEAAPEAVDDARWLDRRDEVLTPLERAVTRRVKRTLTDHENTVRDAVRRHKKGSVPTSIVGTVAELREAVVSAVLGDVAEVVVAGANFHDAETHGIDVDGPAVAELVLTEAVGPVVDPLHARLVAAVDQHTSGDSIDELDAALRSAFREWRNDQVPELSGDLVTAAFNEGILRSAQPGTAHCWVIDDGGVPNPDAEDNRLADAVPAGEPFPTGDLRPPAHAGCRCLLVPAPR